MRIESFNPGRATLSGATAHVKLMNSTLDSLTPHKGVDAVSQDVYADVDVDVGMCDRSQGLENVFLILICFSFMQQQAQLRMYA